MVNCTYMNDYIVYTYTTRPGFISFLGLCEIFAKFLRGTLYRSVCCSVGTPGTRTRSLLAGGGMSGVSAGGGFLFEPPLSDVPLPPVPQPSRDVGARGTSSQHGTRQWAARFPVAPLDGVPAAVDLFFCFQQKKCERWDAAPVVSVGSRQVVSRQPA